MLLTVLLAADAVHAAAQAPRVPHPLGAGGVPWPAVPEPPVRYDTDHLPSSFHQGRRDAVRSALGEGGVAVILGGVEGGGSLSDLELFVQAPDLFYLTGTPEAGSALLLAPGGVSVDGRTVREVLFVPPRSPAVEQWTGRRFGPARAMEELGVELAVPNTRFGEIVSPLIGEAEGRLLLLPPPSAVPAGTALAGQLELLAGSAAGAPAAGADRTSLGAVLQRLREVKEPAEVELLRRAVAITAAAQVEAIRNMEPGWAEYDVQAVIEYTFRRMGSERPGFPSIVASGENSVLLHYSSNRRVMRDGDLVVMDVGASYRGYTGDVTRTVPVSGRFTPEQRAIYEIVLEAQAAGIAEARPGAPFGAPGEAASQVLARGLARLGLLRRPDDGVGLRRFFPHGTSHYLGLQVHDVGSYGPLRPGTVITVEPGIYIPAADDIDPRWWNIGVRIEDVVLITHDGGEVLSGGLPKEPGEIEAMMTGGRPG